MLIESLPPTIGGFHAGPTQSYGTPGLGVSRGFRNNNDVTVSVFVYDQNIDHIPDGVDSSPIQYSFNQAQQDILTMQSMGHYTDVRQMDTQPFAIPIDKKGDLRLLTAKFEYKVIQKNPEDEDAPNLISVQSQLFVTGLNGHIIKLRVTQRLPPSVSINEINNFVATIIQRLASIH